MSWDLRYQAGDTPWDKEAPAPPLLDLLKKSPEYFSAGDVLVPGCGRGHDALAIAKAGHTVIGLDISPKALSDANSLDKEGKVSYQERDFLATTFNDFPKAGTIFEHTCFCAILPNERKAYRDSCKRILPIGGYWVAIIFINPRDEDDLTIGPPFQSSREEIEALFSSDFYLTESYVPDHAFTARKGRELVMIWRRK